MSATGLIAPPSLAADARGLLSLEIPDPDGEVHSYTVERAAAGLDEWAITLTRLDGKGDSPYRVAVDARGKWRCSCPDARWPKRANRGHTGPCKHVVAVVGLKRLVEELK